MVFRKLNPIVDTVQWTMNAQCRAIWLITVTMSLSQSSEISKVFSWKVAHSDFNTAEIFVYLFTANALPFKRLTSSQPVLSCSCEYLDPTSPLVLFKSAREVNWTSAWAKLTVTETMIWIIQNFGDLFQWISQKLIFF